MDLVKFPVSSTNIFPIANSRSGGQLLSEWNLRSRESVSTDTRVTYFIGPSYTHGLDDFKLIGPSEDVSLLPSELKITGGRALVNGHYVELLTDIVIDIAKENYERSLADSDFVPLLGPLCVGLRAFYSDETTTAGSLLVDEDGYYYGIQVVILPRDEFKMPSDLPNDPTDVNAHLKLGEIQYTRDGGVAVSSNNEAKIQMIPADRVGDIQNIVDSKYVTRDNLDPGKHYVMSGKSKTSGESYWCWSDDSLMVWDNDPNLHMSTEEPEYSTSQFVSNYTADRVDLVLAHKQVDGYTNQDNKLLYFPNKVISLPNATVEGNPGVVNRAYTNWIRDIQKRVSDLYGPSALGHYFYLDSYDPGPNDTFDSVLSANAVNIDYVEVHDYVIVRQDHTLNPLSDGTYPSTMYIRLSGVPDSVHEFSAGSVPSPCKLIRTITLPNYTPDYPEGSSPLEQDKRISYIVTNMENYGIYDCVVDESFIRVIVGDDPLEDAAYDYKITSAGPAIWTKPILLTGGTPLATETQVGGFLDVPDTALGYGYVGLDTNGNLRVRDYSLLVSGTLAYQLDRDQLIAGSLEDIQTHLDEYVNSRVAFPNFAVNSDYTDTDSDGYDDTTGLPIYQSSNRSLITITIDLSSTSDPGTININRIDSRFDTIVLIEFTGEGDDGQTINISDCQRLRLKLPDTFNAEVNLYRCNLYYDADILNRVNLIQDLSLWYCKFYSSDSDLTIDGMTVRTTSPWLNTDSVQSSDWWTSVDPNDNHYSYGLYSLTFDTFGTITDIGLMVASNATNDVSQGSFLISTDAVLPNNITLNYPIKRVKRPLKVVGTFVTAYPAENSYNVEESTFSYLTDVYDPTVYTTSEVIKAKFNLFKKVSVESRLVGIVPGSTIDAWRPGSPNLFTGGSFGVN